MLFLTATTDSTNSLISIPTARKLNAFERWWKSIEWEDLTTSIISKVIELTLLTVLFIILLRLADHFIDRGFKLNRNKQNEVRAKTMITLSKNVSHYSLGFFYIYALLSSLGVPVGSLLAGAGIAGLAIGLGAQGFMNDIITGFFIIIEQQFDVGDYIMLTNLDLEGTVVAVGLRTLQLKSSDGTLHFIPNRNITTISNTSRADMRVLVDVRIIPAEGIEGIYQAVERANQQITKDYAAFIRTPPVIFGLIDLGNSNFAIRTSMFVQNGKQAKLQEELLRLSIQNLAEMNFSIPDSPIGVN